MEVKKKMKELEEKKTKKVNNKILKASRRKEDEKIGGAMAKSRNPSECGTEVSEEHREVSRRRE